MGWVRFAHANLLLGRFMLQWRYPNTFKCVVEWYQRCLSFFARLFLHREQSMVQIHKVLKILPDDYYTQIGAIVAKWATLEYLLQTIIWNAMKLGKKRGAY